MKVLHLISTDIYSGAENVACQIILGFKDNEKYQMVYCSECGSNREILNKKGINHFVLKKFNFIHISKAIKKYKPDIIHAHDIKSCIYASIFSNKCKVVGHIHGNHENMREFNLKTFLFNIASRKISKILWVSDSALDNYFFRNKIMSKSEVIYNVVDHEDVYQRSLLAVPEKKYDIIYIGRLTYPKNPERLIEVVSIVKKRIPDITLAIIGSGDLFDTIEYQIRNGQLEDNIDILGYKENPLPYLKNSKIMLMTSRYEGTPMCALEAISLGIPIVSTPTDGLSVIIQNDYNGFLSQSNNDLAMNIISLLQDNKKYSSICKNVKESNKKINNYSEYITIINKIYNGEKNEK